MFYLVFLSHHAVSVLGVVGVGGSSTRLSVTCTRVILVPLMLDEAMEYLENRQVNILTLSLFLLFA